MNSEEYINKLKELYNKAVESGELSLAFNIVCTIRNETLREESHIRRLSRSTLGEETEVGL